jgi:aspartokinase-like uncharacterized kinase
LSIDAVVKLGGSLFADAPAVLGALIAQARTHRLVVVPGGGALADAVRDACAVHDPGPSAAHWMAILAMDQHAHALAGLSPEARLVVDASSISAAHSDQRLAILAPYAWLRVADPLPHSWDVTSDSLACWFAATLGARRLVLLKSVDTTSTEVDRDNLGELVDPHFPKALVRGLECWILSGRHTDRLVELLKVGRTRGTRVR